jgi:UDP-glucose 4-epimerase
MSSLEIKFNGILVSTKVLLIFSKFKIPTKMGVPRDGDLPVVYCDPKLAKEKLGWSAELGLDEMCRDLWNWQQQNPIGYNSEA